LWYRIHTRKEDNKKMNKLFLVILVICSCTNKDIKSGKNITEGITVIQKDSLYKLISSALNNNDTIAYNAVASYYILNNMSEEFLFTAIKMANKYNNAEACYHVYDIIAYSSSKGSKEALENLDFKTKNLALYYLTKSHEIGFESSKYEIIEIFGDEKPPYKSSYFLKEFSKE
jgi:hypothetical protein